ncbi:acetoin utilization protein AcuC [Corynebacterium poyangense]|uniref:Acetoin utilization protein AcuC n=1 Tax=Corynebacterium poyangense TaxID=2684405 RepID=A0A7H0SL66_9CORY|nr:acetoin utilization protein AcuC [Corynebacterium poyangense]QNQ89291.1 acetoin utilization protein AcuC [Corynebacterium poyangense]
MKPLLINTEEIHHYHLGDQHPMGPDRVTLALELSEYLGLSDAFRTLHPDPADDPTLELVHSAEYLAATRSTTPQPEFGIGTDDNPLNPGLSEVAARICGGALAATQEVWQGRAPRAVNLAGGLHHAFPSYMSGFCMYNDAAIAIEWLLQFGGAQRVAYIDLDAHHGDAVEKVFWDDPRVLTISVHESGLYLFPGTGFAHEIGGPDAVGTVVNLALPKECDDEEWLQGIHALIPPLLKKFAPELIITQHGADPHRHDPLADLNISMEAIARAYHSMATWAEEYADGKWVALGGGGYRRDSVARAWANVLAAVSHQEIDPHTPMPENWAHRVGSGGFGGSALPSGSSHSSESIPPAAAFMGDLTKNTAADRFDPTQIHPTQPRSALIATSRSVFPYWGLQPYG